MKPFRSPEEMLDAHELMFGEAGRRCAEVVLKWATTLFAVPLDGLNVRVVLAPVELGPYNRHRGYHYGREGSGTFILGNRHIVQLSGGTLVLAEQSDEFLIGFEDFIVHELTHARQDQLLREHPDWKVTRGAHRDLGWYSAVAEACPRYLGVELPRSSWPKGPRTPDSTLTEVQMCHWPMSLRALAMGGDSRLPKVTATRVDVREPNVRALTFRRASRCKKVVALTESTAVIKMPSGNQLTFLSQGRRAFLETTLLEQRSLVWNFC